MAKQRQIFEQHEFSLAVKSLITVDIKQYSVENMLIQNFAPFSGEFCRTNWPGEASHLFNRGIECGRQSHVHGQGRRQLIQGS
jgi:hypothetical protein